MALAESQSTEPSSQMRTSSSSTARLVFSPWPTPERTPTALNFSSPPLLLVTSMASMLSSARSSRVTKSSKLSKMSPRVQETNHKSPSRSPRVASCRCQKKVSTWSYKVLSFLQYTTIHLLPLHFRLWTFTTRDCQAGHADQLCASDEEYGHAEFQPGQEEPVELPVAASTAAVSAPAKTTEAAPVVPVVPVIPTTPKEDAEAAEGYSVLQKGLFFTVIMGCVVAYLKMTNKNVKRRFTEKSMA